MVLNESDRKMLADAKKLQSFKNWQPLEILCMKTILKNFRCLSASPLLEKLAPPVKTSFLQFLMQMNELKKNIPLNLDQKLQLVHVLLNSTVKKFDFGVLGLARESMKQQYELSKDTIVKWNKIFDDLWKELAAKCPNLLQVTEIRPHPLRTRSLNNSVFTFSKLISLETSCTINSGSIEKLCTNLKQLVKLIVDYEHRNFSNVGILSKLENLRELKLSTMVTAGDVNREMDDFNEAFTQKLPKLKTYGYTWLDSDFALIGNFKKLAPCALEKCVVKTLATQDDFLRLAACLPNLQCLKIRSLRNFNPQVMINFKNLTSLDISCDQSSIQILDFIGHQLKELGIFMSFFEAGHWPFNVLKVLISCPNLENLVLFDFKGPVDLQVPVAAENLKLKKLNMCGNFNKAKGFLPLVLKAPGLEELKLSVFTKQDIATLTADVKKRAMLQNLMHIELDCYDDSADHRKNLLVPLENLAKSIVSCCPKLQTAYFEFDGLSADENYKTETNSSVAPFWNILKSI